MRGRQLCRGRYKRDREKGRRAKWHAIVLERHAALRENA